MNDIMLRKANRDVLLVKKYGPQILTGFGCIGVVGGTVLACRATLKADKALAKRRNDIQTIKTAREECTEEEYTEKEYKSDLIKTYTGIGIDLVKLYSIPAAVIGGSLACFIISNKQQSSRISALSSAYAGVLAAFEGYRGRVKNAIGEEEEKDIYYGIEKKEVEIETVDEKGKVKKETVTLKVPTANNSDGYSMYSKFFDSSSREWEKNAEYNLYFLRKQQEWATQKLRRQGYLFLNDVLESLDIPKTAVGQVVGWVYDESKTAPGDNEVDFGIYDLTKQPNRDFVNGFEPVILLDFNVQGNILDLIEK